MVIWINTMKKLIMIILMLGVGAGAIVASYFRQYTILNKAFSEVCLQLDRRKLSRNDQEVLHRFLLFGAEIDTDCSIMSPMEIALAGHKDSLLKYLLVNNHCPRIDLEVNYPVSQYGMEQLLRLGKRLDFQDEYGNTLLLIHAGWSESEAVPALLQKGLSDPNAKNHRGYTPLHMACRYNTIAVVKELLQYNAMVNVVSYRGYTPLHMAVGRKDPDLPMIELLLNCGADINAVDCDGNSALFFAKWYGRPEVVVHLLKQGADPNLRNAQNQTYLEALPPEKQYFGVL